MHSRILIATALLLVFFACLLPIHAEAAQPKAPTPSTN